MSRTDGYTGRIAFVDLTKEEVVEEKLDEGMAQDFIGGYGLGARILFERQKPGIDPLGPENILGFTTGPLTGTQVPTGARYMVVCKSPLTGGWGDANSGGYFGSAMKMAGWDAIFISGIASSPKFLLVTSEGISIKPADHLWGKDTVETEELLKSEFSFTPLRIASIGPASEKLSLISGIANDKGRFAARSGVGAVMGSKRLKAVVAYGKEKVAVADQQKIDELRKPWLKGLKESQGLPKLFMKYGTSSITAAVLIPGGTPVKNWQLAGEQAFPTIDKIGDGEKLLQYQTKKFGCSNCPIACGGIFSVKDGAYPVEETHKPEYETLAAFGPMCLNDDLFSIIKLNDMCNRSGLDTISAGSVIAFAMECFENGVLTLDDLDGIELKWGDGDATIALLDKIIRREGIGDILADGVKIAAEKIGRGAEAYAIHVGGQEPGMHNSLFMPGRGTGYVTDPTPGRHTTAVMSRLDSGAAQIAPYPELQFKNFERYEYKKKGKASALVSNYYHLCSCAGVCLFPSIIFGDFPFLDFFNAVTGWNIEMKEAFKTGARIQTLRKCFNVREGIKHTDTKLPNRMVGIPPMSEGPLAGVTIDIDSLASEYYKAMNWDQETGSPLETALADLGIMDLIKNHWE